MGFDIFDHCLCDGANTKVLENRQKEWPLQGAEALADQAGKGELKAGPRSGCPRARVVDWPRPRAGSHRFLQRFCEDVFVGLLL